MTNRETLAVLVDARNHFNAESRLTHERPPHMTRADSLQWMILEFNQDITEVSRGLRSAYQTLAEILRTRDTLYDRMEGASILGAEESENHVIALIGQHGIACYQKTDTLNPNRRLFHERYGYSLMPIAIEAVPAKDMDEIFPPERFPTDAVLHRVVIRQLRSAMK
jgi:hypothetical protein